MVFTNEDVGYCDKTRTVAPHIQEEYLVNGKFDFPYISKKFDKHVSVKEGTSQVNTALGTVVFVMAELENEVSFKEFKSVYKFGKFPNVRGWITELFIVTGKLLTRKKLYEYILKC